MRPLTDAFTPADAAAPSSTPEGVGGSSRLAVPDGDRFGLVRETRNDFEPGAISSTAIDVGEPAGHEVSGGPAGQGVLGERWPGPIHATRDDVDAAALDDGFTAFGPSSPDDSARPAPRPPDERLDAGGARSPAYRAFDPRALPRRSGAGRIVVTVLSMLAVAGAMAGGGHFFWKTELVRPALVRHQPPTPSPDMEPVPMHAANVTADAASGAAPRTDERLRPPTPESAQAAERPRHFAPESAEGSRTKVAAEAPGREDAARVRAVPSTGASISGRAAGFRTLPVVEATGPERMERVPMPAQAPMPTQALVPAQAREHRTMEPAPSVFPSGQPGRTGSGARDHFPAFRAAARVGAVEAPVGAVAGGLSDPADFPEPGPAPTGTGPRSGSGGGIEIRKRVRPDHVAELLERAYEMFRAGHVEPAAEAYRVVLGHEPRNRDALLGLAAVAAREGRWEEAAGRYGQALASDPADIVAQAALIAITIDEQDPAHGERRLKALLRSEPRAAYLHFSLGNVYAARSRWSEAQRSYLDAWHLDSGNADYAYNLAVSLDHLARPESALGFYRQALALTRSRPASFETAAAVARIRDMEASSGGAVATGRSLSEPAVAAPDGPTAAASAR